MAPRSLGTIVGEVTEPTITDFAKYLGECASGLFFHGNLEMFLLRHLYSKVKMEHLVTGCGFQRSQAS